MHARWYDAKGGTFLSIDPVVPVAADPQSYNAYAYARNNPISLADPTGRDWFDELQDLQSCNRCSGFVSGPGYAWGPPTGWTPITSIEQYNEITNAQAEAGGRPSLDSPASTLADGLSQSGNQYATNSGEILTDTRTPPPPSWTYEQAVHASSNVDLSRVSHSKLQTLAQRYGAAITLQFIAGALVGVTSAFVFNPDGTVDFVAGLGVGAGFSTTLTFTAGIVAGRQSAVNLTFSAGGGYFLAGAQINANVSLSGGSVDGGLLIGGGLGVFYGPTVRLPLK